MVNVHAKPVESNDTLVYDLSQEYFLLYKSSDNGKKLDNFFLEPLRDLKV